MAASTHTPTPEPRPMHDLNVLALIKGVERFVFVYDDVSRGEIVAAIRDTAADAGTAFNWFDAAVLIERTKHQAVAAVAPDDAMGGDATS